MLVLALGILVGPEPCPGLPLTPNTSWAYTADVAWSVAGTDSVGRRTIGWTTTVMSLKTSDSTAVAVVSGWPSELAWWEPGRVPALSVLYCSPGRVYHLELPAGRSAEALADSILAGDRPPTPDDLILELPLRSGLLFGRDSTERDDTFYAWYVESAQDAPAALRTLARSAGDSVYHLAYRTFPDHQLVAFLPGLGVIRYVYKHHGTTAEADATLVGFHPGPRRAAR